MSIVADRKKTAQQPRTNPANQHQGKKGNNKQTPQVAAQNPNQKDNVRATVSSDPPKPKSSPPPAAQPKQQQQQQQQQQQSQAKEHVSLKGFNSTEIDELLSRGIDPQAEVYKSEQPQAQKSGPWGQKAGTMATGKDFWIELRRQVGVLQRGESTNKGG